MRQFLGRHSPTVEFTIVIVVAFSFALVYAAVFADTAQLTTTASIVLQMIGEAAEPAGGITVIIEAVVVAVLWLWVWLIPRPGC